MEGRFKPLRPRACDACRKRKVRQATLAERLQTSLWSKTGFLSCSIDLRFAAMVSKRLEGTALIALRLDVRDFDF